MRFHVINLPHTSTTSEYVHCAYTMKVKKFCDMMHGLGHQVYLYGSDENEANVTEHINVISREKQQEFFGDNDHKKKFFNITWNPNDPHWRYMNARAIAEIGKRMEPKDFICIIGGVCQKEIADAFPQLMSVEYGIGYTGTFSKYRVFESYAHMHYVRGLEKNDNGSFYDKVIPNYYDPAEFPFSEDRGQYFLFIGRLIDRKGYRIAQQVCEEIGAPLLLAGQGEHTGYGTHVGTVGVEDRGRLMSRAVATFVPTTYLEPFGGVHAESMLCGTPVITTDFGVFTETVIPGSGWRCQNFRDFVAAAEEAGTLPDELRRDIRGYAIRRFGMDYVRYEYENYFDRLLDLWQDGWYQR